MKIFSALKAAKDIGGQVPDEFMVFEIGQIEIEDSKPVLFDKEAAEAVLRHFNTLNHDMVIDYEHQTLGGGKAPAAGWCTDLILKSDGLYAVVKWTDEAAGYLKTGEYRYFSPVFFYDKKTRRIKTLYNLALTNQPRMKNIQALAAKLTVETGFKPVSTTKQTGLKPVSTTKQTGLKPVSTTKLTVQTGLKPVSTTKLTVQTGFKPVSTTIQKQEEKLMLKKLRELFKLKDDASEDEALEACKSVAAEVETLSSKLKEADGSSEMVACKPILDALGLDGKADAKKACDTIAGLKAPATAAQELSQQVAKLTTKISAMESSDLVSIALKAGKTSPEEITAWGKDLAEKSPEQFKKIVLSRPEGSVVPLHDLAALKTPAEKQDVVGETQLSINKSLGISTEDFKKYA